MFKLLEKLNEYRKNHPEYTGIYFVLYLDGSGRLYDWENKLIFDFKDQEEFLEKLKA